MSNTIRLKCTKCGHIADYQSDLKCLNCGAELTNNSEGSVYIYRDPAFVGFAAGYGVYINNQPYGHIGNGETAIIPLPFGKYTVHLTCGMTRNCEDATIELTKEKPEAFVNAKIKTGFWSNKIITSVVEKSQFKGNK